MILLKRVLFTFLLLGAFYQTYAQFGVSGIYNLHRSADTWDSDIPVSGDHVKANGFGATLNYWFRLKQYRIEFLPEIGYLTGSQSDVLIDDASIDLAWQQIALFANVNFYLFDFMGDCNCPTFGKDGNFFQKGFFVQVSPGASYSTNTSTIDGEEFESSGVHFLAGLGAGLDIGVSEYFTITLFIRYVIGFDAAWPQANFAGETTEVTSSTRDILTGINFLYRLDYKKNRF